MQSETSQAVITGGTGSLGRALAFAFRETGWIVEAPGSDTLDMRDANTLRLYFHQRPVDLLICAAGATHDVLLARLSPQIWDEIWTVNYQGARDCAHAVLPGMISRRRGHIVFISSFSALQPPHGQAAYATAKAALLGLTRDLAQRHGPSNIRVNCVLPGFMETRMTKNISETRRAEVLSSHALGRFNTSERVAAFIHFLHHELPYTSGQVFQLDSR